MIYSFVCIKCKHQFDEQMSVVQFDQFKAKKINIRCPKCNTIGVRNIITAAPVHFKGNGWTKSSC